MSQFISLFLGLDSEVGHEFEIWVLNFMFHLGFKSRVKVRSRSNVRVES